MTPERMAGLVARWVRLYTRDLPAPVADRRIEELDADLHDHIAHERARGTGDGRIARAIASRLIRGLPADASWRAHNLTRLPTRKDPRMSRSTHRSAVRIAVVTALALLVPLVAMQFSDGVDWGVFDFVFAGLLLGTTGALYELAVRNPRNVVFRIAATVIGVAAIVLGELDDAPGLVLFGLLLIIGTVAMTVRTAQLSR